LIVPPEESQERQKDDPAQMSVRPRKRGPVLCPKQGWLNLDKSKSGSFFRVEVEQIRHGMLAIAVAVAGITTNTRIDKSDGSLGSKVADGTTNIDECCHSPHLQASSKQQGWWVGVVGVPGR
jgi:hypothetical protein